MDIFSKGKRAGLYALLIASALVLLLLGMLIGRSLAHADERKAAQKGAVLEQAMPLTPAGTPAAGALEDKPIAAMASLSSGAEVIWEEYFSGCGHTLRHAGGESAGMTREELQRRFLSYEIADFSVDRAILRAQRAGYCPAHYLLCEKNGKLLITRRSQESLENECVMELEIDLAEMRGELPDELKEGIAFDALEQINEYMENIES